MESQEEQILQDLLRQKLNGSPEISPLPAGELMDRFLAELMILNDEVTNQREGSFNKKQTKKMKFPVRTFCVFKMQTKRRLTIAAASWPMDGVKCRTPAPIRVVRPSIPTCRAIGHRTCHVTLIYLSHRRVI